MEFDQILHLVETVSESGLSLIHIYLEDGIISCGGEMTVLQLVQKYVGQKTGVRHNTEANYNFVINIIKKEAFGNRRIDKVKLSDAKGWLIKLQACLLYTSGDNGTITGNLIGVTISGDLIEGNTIVAEKLVIKGDDGLYYKLNTDGVTTESEQTDYNSLNGNVIRAKSVTAEKINVSDLVDVYKRQGFCRWMVSGRHY